MLLNGSQSEFAKALLARTAPPPALRLAGSGEDLERRFGVYRNNVFAGLVSVLATRFAATARLVGEEFFWGMAAEFVADHPPETPVMLEYGARFASFILRFAPARELPYLPGVATLEWLRHEAMHAADCAPLALDSLTALDPTRLGETTLTLHPATRIFASDYPAVTLWRLNHNAEEGPEELAGPEAALVVRPCLSVQVHMLGPGAYAFLSLLDGGATLGDAVDAARNTDGNFDLAQTLALAFGAGAIAATTQPKSSA